MKIRSYVNDKMYYNTYHWDSLTMACSNHTDCNDVLIYENDFLKFRDGIMIVKKGQFNFHNMLLYGWYLEYYKDNQKKILPFRADRTDDYEVISNIYDNYKIYEKIKENKWGEVIDFIR